MPNCCADGVATETKRTTMAQKIIRCTDRHFERMLEFVGAHNPASEHHIGYFGATPADIRQSVLMLNLRYNRGFRLALEGNRLIGVMGVDFDKEIGRAWLYGPIVVADDWAATADALYAAVTPALPVGIHEHEMFVDTENGHCRAFAAWHGFRNQGEMEIQFITPDRLAALPEQTAEEWDGRFADRLIALHNQLFPRSNFTLNYMLSERDKGATLLLLTDGDELAGYFFGRADAVSGEAFVDFVGVDPARHGQGLGRRLMLAGLARQRVTPNLHQVNLTVKPDNLPALRLYESLGFVRERGMVAFRRKVRED